MMRAPLFVVIGAVAAGGFATVAFALHRVGYSRGYAPVQPIAFSHALHAGTFEVPCRYCHFGAERGRHAGIPPTSVCMGCHRQLTIRTRDTARLLEAYEQRRPIAWVRVHDLPDFVAFHHARHVRVARLACEACHGAVAAMERLRQHAPLTMGWCLDCHRARGVTPTADRSHRDPSALHAIGGLDCAKCHH